MRIQLLKRLRKEAYKEYGILEIITNEGLQKFIVGKRRYIEDHKKWWGSFVVTDFLVDAKKVLLTHRREYILKRVKELRREEQNIFVSVRNKEFRKL